ncbi:unnamed protein product [Calicophoron daubneyi]|uniref:XPG-I domain-containing protein n=1 Tax=Calicophoron daubneyi TaxID=300641 RepID=A0AAV2T424_CALDB
MRVVQLARERLDAHSSFMEYSLSLSDDQASNTELISSNQVNRLLLRRRLAQRQDELAVILAREEVAEQLAQMNDSQLRSALHSQIALLRGEGSGTIEELSTTALRIQSRDSGHAILVKKSPMKPSTGISAQRSGSVLTLQSLIQKISGRTAFQEEELEQQTEENENAELKHNHENPSASSDKELVKKPETETQAPVMPTQEEKEITKLECHEVVCQTISEDSDSKRDLVQSAKPQTQEPATGVANKNVSSRITGTDVEPSELKAVPPKIITEAEEKEDIALTHIEPPSESVVDNSPSAFTHTPAKSTVRSELDVKIIENELEEKKGNEPISTGEEAEFIIHDEEEEDDEFIEVPTEELPTSPKPLSDDGTESNTEESEVELEGPHSPTAGTEEHFGVGSLSDEDHFELDDDVLREEADRFSRQAQTTTTRCITEAQELLRLFGAPFLVSPQEAEAQCATLQRLGLVDFVASDDSDVWPFGARTVCRHLFGGGDDRTKSRTAAVHSPSCYSADDIRDTVGLSPANIIRLALLCGSDYTPGIQNVGPVTAVEILSEFGQSGDPAESESLSWLEGVEATDNLVGDIINPLKHFQEWWKSTSMKQEPCPNKDCKTPNASPVRRKWLKLTPPAGFPDPRVVEAYLNPQVTTDLKPFVWEAPNVESLVSYAAARFGWRRETTEPMLRAVLKRQHERTLGSARTDTLITNYFSKQAASLSQPDKPDEVTLPSKRVRKAASRLRSRKMEPTENEVPNQGSGCTGDTTPSLRVDGGNDIVQVKNEDADVKTRKTPELPCPASTSTALRKRTSRKVTSKKLNEENEGDWINKSNVKQKPPKSRRSAKSSRQPQRRVVLRVALSESDDE